MFKDKTVSTIECLRNAEHKKYSILGKVKTTHEIKREERSLKQMEEAEYGKE